MIRDPKKIRCHFELLAMTLMLLAGCEAPLDLSGVDAQSSLALHRSDLFQAVANHQDTAIAVGSMGTIVKSDDGGINWHRATLPGKPFLVDVTVCPDGGFHAIEKTDGIWSRRTDGQWTRQALPEMTEPQAVTCDPSGTIWVVGGFSTIVYSGDAAASWDSWSLDEDLYLTTVQFIDRQHGVVTGEFGTVLLTTNGGASWDRGDDLPCSFYPQDAWFRTPATGWIVGLNGTIWETVSGGQSWQKIQTGINIPLYGLSGDDQSLVAVGDNATILYHTTGDSAWTLLDDAIKSRTYLRGIIGLGDGRFITAGGGGTLSTVKLPRAVNPAGKETADE